MKKTEQQLADEMIKELEEAGFSYDDMIRIFRLARIKYNQMNKSKKG